MDTARKTCIRVLECCANFVVHYLLQWLKKTCIVNAGQKLKKKPWQIWFLKICGKKTNNEKHKEWYQSILNNAVFQTGWQHDICKVASESESTNIVPTHPVECEGEGNVLAAGTKKTRQLTDGAKNSA